MSEWPEGWFRKSPGAGEQPGGAGAGDPTAALPAGTRPPGAGAGPWPARPAAAGAGPRSAWPEQPPPSSADHSAADTAGLPVISPSRGGGDRGYRPAPAPAPAGPGSYRRGGGRAWLRPRRILGVLAVLVALILVATMAEYFNLNGKLHRQDILASYAGQPAQGSGTNWLIAGSDTRQGLTRKQLRKLSAGLGVAGHRSDTIMVMHMPSSGPPILISIPRDSWVNIPGYGNNKINAAYDFGGSKLLAKTVQNATGLRIDHYMEIGFGGFVGVVNALGGVHMCIKHALNDYRSGLHIRKGCQTLDGAQALGFVRDRHSFAAGQDLQRIQDQRLLLRALLAKLTGAGTLLNPFAVIPAASQAAKTLTVDNGTSLLQLAQAAFALRHPDTTTVPIATPSYLTPTGQDAVLWNRSQALTLFNDLNQGKTVPKSLITGSRQA